MTNAATPKLSGQKTRFELGSLYVLLFRLSDIDPIDVKQLEGITNIALDVMRVADICPSL
jgi:hypothetical protein